MKTRFFSIPTFPVALLLAALTLVYAALPGGSRFHVQAAPLAQGKDELSVDDDIRNLLETEDLKGRIPGVIAAIAEEGKPIRIASRGVLRFKRNLPLSIDRQMHMGSCTKAMTSVLVGVLVDEGKLTFDDTIAERLPELAKVIDKNYGEVTLFQCLTHTSGMPANAKNWWLNFNDEAMGIREKRKLIAIDSLQVAPEHKPGTNFLYSNLGYMVAGMMVEEVMQMDWESAIEKKLFEPLGIDEFGFGIPGKSAKQRQPWGHRFNDQKQIVSVQGDNAPALGPAGTSFMPVAQWARFVLVNNQGYRLAENPDAPDCELAKSLVQPSTWKRIFTPSQVDGKTTHCACGWFLARRGWAQGISINHTGSNTTWFCSVWASPQLKKAYLVAVNIAGEETDQFVDQLVAKLIDLDRNSPLAK